MDADALLMFDGMTGEAADKDHAGAILISSWEWGASWRGSAALSGSKTGVGEVREFTVHYRMDATAPAAMARCVRGVTIASATLWQRRAGGAKAQVFLEIAFKKVRFTNVSVSQGSEDFPVVTATFSFADVSFDYTPQSAQGADKGKSNFRWSVASAD